MATSVKRSPFVTPRSSRAYRLEMEGRTIFFLLGLLILTGVVVYSLGVVTGMGMRDPSAGIPVATAPPPVEETTPAGESLAFNTGVTASEQVIEGLKMDQAQTAGQTKKLLGQGERVLTLDEVPQTRAARPAATATTPPVAASPAAARPEARAPATPPQPASAELYTVQVFSSRTRETARELVARLKKLGFSAYMNQYQSSDRTTWYRVRVGKNPRSDAELLVQKLKEQAKLKAPQIVRL